MVLGILYIEWKCWVWRKEVQKSVLVKMHLVILPVERCLREIFCLIFCTDTAETPAVTYSYIFIFLKMWRKFAWRTKMLKCVSFHEEPCWVVQHGSSKHSAVHLKISLLCLIIRHIWKITVSDKVANFFLSSSNPWVPHACWRIITRQI